MPRDGGESAEMLEESLSGVSGGITCEKCSRPAYGFFIPTLWVCANHYDELNKPYKKFVVRDQN